MVYGGTVQDAESGQRGDTLRGLIVAEEHLIRREHGTINMYAASSELPRILFSATAKSTSMAELSNTIIQTPAFHPADPNFIFIRVSQKTR